MTTKSRRLSMETVEVRGRASLHCGHMSEPTVSEMLYLRVWPTQSVNDNSMFHGSVWPVMWSGSWSRLCSPSRSAASLAVALWKLAGTYSLATRRVLMTLRSVIRQPTLLSSPTTTRPTVFGLSSRRDVPSSDAASQPQPDFPEPSKQRLLQRVVDKEDHEMETMHRSYITSPTYEVDVGLAEPEVQVYRSSPQVDSFESVVAKSELCERIERAATMTDHTAFDFGVYTGSKPESQAAGTRDADF
ncbi:hypothetical protein DOTSEDRAFT_36387 [Dothistroma septosporum NZE10]|uniref:Uncharacterized protein n=1 Tax=Dothistroma septosporum (strain NZE10 / CBS 128990) TaxID=675120 RepID=N1PIV8_DOTSN|nr:hypothetical protein DOTSEDRAFT_36387 [Dothistroma septosporum NZE10]